MKKVSIFEHIEVDKDKKSKSLENIRIETAQYKPRYIPGIGEILLIQLRYLSPVCGAGQGMCAAALAGFLLLIYGKPLELSVYLGMASALSAFMGVFLIIEIGRSGQWGMAEIEQSCYLDLRQSWCVKILMFSALDTVLLLLLSTVVSLEWREGLMRTAVYLLVPFLIANALYLFVFSRWRGGERAYFQMGVALLCGGLAALPPMFPDWYEEGVFYVWLFLLAAAMIVCGVLVMNMLRKLERGEEVCWN